MAWLWLSLAEAEVEKIPEPHLLNYLVKKKQTMTFLTAPKTQYDWNREIGNRCYCAKDPQIINHTALLGSLFLV